MKSQQSIFILTVGLPMLYQQNRWVEQSCCVYPTFIYIDDVLRLQMEMVEHLDRLNSDRLPLRTKHTNRRVLDSWSDKENVAYRNRQSCLIRKLKKKKKKMIMMMMNNLWRWQKIRRTDVDDICGVISQSYLQKKKTQYHSINLLPVLPNGAQTRTLT